VRRQAGRAHAAYLTACIPSKTQQRLVHHRGLSCHPRSQLQNSRGWGQGLSANAVGRGNNGEITKPL